jgi:DNA-binding IclR family transcriptional regulator
VAEQSKTVDAALRLLSILGTGPTDAPGADEPQADGSFDSSAAAFARRLRLSRTAVGRILTTLETHGLARRTAGGWHLGLGVLALAGRIEPVLRAAARPVLEDLAARFGETAVLALPDGAEVVAVDQVVASRDLVQVRYRPGTRHPLDRAAHGRALLRDGAAAGYVVSEGEPELGVKAVAAPVFAETGTADGTSTADGTDGPGACPPLASIGLVAPSHRFPPDAEVVDAVRAAARTVTAELAAGQPTEGGDRDAVLPAYR